MVLFYTGTGNSAYVAKRIADGTKDEVLNLFEKIRDKDYSEINSDRPWVIVAPTYAWQVPVIVKDWVARAELKGNKDVYFVLTCGDSIGNAAGYAEKLCRGKGMNFKGLSMVVMPENYIAMFSAPGEAESKEIIKRSEPVIDGIVSSILAGKDLNKKTSLAGAVLSGPVNKGFYKFSVKDKDFRVLDSCNGCGLCAKKCIMSNISLAGGKPSWSGNCTHCMACICYCPKEAIEYGTKSVGQPRYKCPR